MATELSEQLTRLGHKAEVLVTRYGTLKAENAQLKAENAELQAEIAAAKATIEQMSIELEYLKVSSAIAPDTQSAIRARATLSDLVREIDACLADLIKDV